MKIDFRVLIVAGALANPVSALADTISGGSGALQYNASSLLVGQTSTATLAGGGNPIYFANLPQYSGVVTLIMNEGSAGTFICSGSLLADRVSILTAGHCVSHGAGTANPISTTAYFGANINPDSVVYTDPTSVAIPISSYKVDPLYTGQVVDDNDIAVLTLSTPAPITATGYSLYTGTDVGSEFNVAGYGQRSNVGGSVGATPSATGPGRLRQGTNTFDFTLGDPLFGGDFEPGGGNAFGTADDSQILMADFDNGTAAHDSSCILAGYFGGGGPQFCNTGTGATEVDTAPGDSGGPEFINGEIASVTSFGVSFGMSFGDTDNSLNSSFGEFAGYVPTDIHSNFILGVPEPSTWAMLITGFGLLGLAGRRRRVTAPVRSQS